jgi:hypothetical protein
MLKDPDENVRGAALHGIRLMACRIDRGGRSGIQAEPAHAPKVEGLVQIRQLTKAEQEWLLDWLANIVEDQLEFTDQFKAKMERGEQDIREGRVRIRKP